MCRNLHTQRLVPTGVQAQRWMGRLASLRSPDLCVQCSDIFHGAAATSYCRHFGNIGRCVLALPCHIRTAQSLDPGPHRR
jgi:hypothetical protein